MRKKKQNDRDHVFNLWLKYHNLTVDDLMKKHTLEELSNPKWFELYPVTQEQYDTWEEEVKKYLKATDKDMVWVKLDCGPTIR